MDSSANGGGDDPADLEEDWVTLSDLCKSQGVGYRTGLAWIRKGWVKSVMVGGRHRIYASEVRRFLTEGNAKRE